MTTIITAFATLAAAAVLAAIFYFQPSHGRAPSPTRRGYRRFVSFSGGTALAYVFVRLLPELSETADNMARATAHLALPLPELRVYEAALLGFMLFYGLEHLVAWSDLRAARRIKHQPAAVAHAIVDIAPPDEGNEADTFPLRVLTVSYALYAFVVSYSMAHTMEVGGGQLALFTIAMGLHFIGVKHGLRRERQALYDTWGRYLLAAAPVLGWVVALFLPLGDATANLLLGFVAGSLIMNTMTLELPGKKDGKFFSFLAGGVAYTAVLLLTAPRT